MSIPIFLIQMPKVPMKNIFEYLDFRSILVLRKVCHDLRNFIDDKKSASCLTEIHVNVNPDSISFNLNLPPIYIEYLKNREGCLVKCKKEGNVKETILENEDYVRVFCKDFDIVLRHQKTVLEHFTIILHVLNAKERILGSVNKSFKSMNHLLRAKYLYMGVENHKDIMSILPYIDPKPLEFIDINGVSTRDNDVLNLNEIGQLEQWKGANKLIIRGFQILDLSHNFKHFSWITLYLREVSIEKMILLKEMFSCSSTLNTMEIEYNTNFIVINQRLIQVFGQPSLDSRQDKNWFFRIPGTNPNQFLKIKLVKDRCIHFSRIEQSDVPQNAIILN